MTSFCLLSVQMYDMLFIRDSGTVSAGLLPPVCFLSVQDAGCYASITLGLDLCPDLMQGMVGQTRGVFG